MNNKIILRFKGGLGNQLFIFFYGIYLSKKYNSKIIFDSHSGFVRDKKYNRKFQLNKVVNTSSFIFFPKFKYNLDLIYINFFKLFGTNNLLSKFSKIILINDTNQNTDISNYRYVLVDGYFQDISFFFTCESEISPLIKFVNQTYASEKKLTLHLRFYNNNLIPDLKIIKENLFNYIHKNNLHGIDKFIISEKGINSELIAFLCKEFNFTHIEFNTDIEEFNFLIDSDIILNIQSSFSMTASLLRRLKFGKDKTIIHFPLRGYIDAFPQNWLNF